jgi:hypothetical protein
MAGIQLVHEYSVSDPLLAPDPPVPLVAADEADEEEDVVVPP